MPVIETRLNPRDAAFIANRSALEALVRDLKSKVRAIEQGGGEVARTRHTGRG
jgi:3-methylcrotonyl-CoA carboxylase beta subunit